MTQKSDTIITAATQAFAEAGYAGARMDDIALRAGVNKATIYYKIGNKESLYREVLQSMFDTSVTTATALIHKTESPEEQLRLFVRTIADVIDTNPCLPNIIMWEHASGGENMPDIIARQIAGIILLLTEILTRGERAGIFKKVSPMLIQFMVMGTLMLYKTSAPIRNSHDAFPDIAKSLPEAVSGPMANELEELIISAVKH